MLSVFSLASSKMVDSSNMQSDALCWTTSKRITQSLPYVGPVARACSLIAISNLTDRYIRTPHPPLSLQHPIPSWAQTHYIYLLIQMRRILSDNASIFLPIIHCRHIPPHLHLPRNHRRPIPRAASRHRYISLASLPCCSTIRKPKPAPHTQSQNLPRTPCLSRLVARRRRSLG